jgi:hypothetical protein
MKLFISLFILLFLGEAFGSQGVDKKCLNSAREFLATPLDLNSVYHGEEMGLAYYFSHTLNIKHHRVIYLSQEERRNYEVIVDQGKLYYKDNGELVGNMFEPGGLTGIYVMDLEGRIYISYEKSKGYFHHSSLVGGESVAAAGEITVIDGEVMRINRSSGHYQPQTRHFNQFIEKLRKLGADLSEAELNDSFY